MYIQYTQEIWALFSFAISEFLAVRCSLIVLQRKRTNMRLPRFRLLTVANVCLSYAELRSNYISRSRKQGNLGRTDYYASHFAGKRNVCYPTDNAMYFAVLQMRSYRCPSYIVMNMRIVTCLPAAAVTAAGG